MSAKQPYTQQPQGQIYTPSPLKADLENAQGRFIAYLGPHASVLDITCGNGKTLHYFNKKGLAATGLEPQEEKARAARLLTGCKVYHAPQLAAFTPSRLYDGLWMQNLLPFTTPTTESQAMLEHIWQWLKHGGVLYASFKNSLLTPPATENNSVSGFSLTECKQIFGQLKGAEVLETWTSSSTNNGVVWQNIILRKN